MIAKNSGKIFRFELDFNLGYAYCMTFDFTDLSPFSGNIIKVFDYLEKEINPEIDIYELLRRPSIIGHHPMIKLPNSRGKGAWKLVGQIKHLIPPHLIFKYNLQSHTNKDWTKLKKWQTWENFKNITYNVSYSKIRHLEMSDLYGKESLKIRTTMYYLIMNNKKVSDFYDLKDFHNRNLYIDLCNTNFSIEKAKDLLKEI